MYTAWDAVVNIPTNLTALRSMDLVCAPRQAALPKRSLMVGCCGPRSLAIDTTGTQRTFYVGTMNNIYKVSYDGAYQLFSGSPTASGNKDGPATDALFNFVMGLVRDAAGYLYTAEYFGYRIRKVSPTGAVVTILGGTDGDVDGIGTSACVGTLRGLRLVPGGDAMYVADYSKNKVRHVAIVAAAAATLPAPIAFGTVPLPLSPIAADV